MASAGLGLHSQNVSQTALDPKPHILVVDDDPVIRQSLNRFLASNGMTLSVAADARAARAMIDAGRFDVLVLDVMMPGEDGLSLCRSLRAQTTLPIILLTAMTSETDRIIGLELGADDYVCKPFNPRELLARIRAILRRVERTPHAAVAEKPAAFTFEGWHVDPVRRTLRSPTDALVELTGGEFDLLLAFVANPNKLLSRDLLLDMTKGRAPPAYDRSIDVQISRLRRKIEPDPQQPIFIKTVRSNGYIFAAKVVRHTSDPG